MSCKDQHLVLNAAASLIGQLPLLRIFVPSLLRTAARPHVSVSQLNVYVIYDADDPLLDLRRCGVYLADVLRESLRRAFEAVPGFRIAVLRFAKLLQCHV